MKDTSKKDSLPEILTPDHKPVETASPHYSDFAVIDSMVLHHLTTMLNRSDLSHVLKMTLITSGYYNALYNGRNFHNANTLQQYLEVKSKSMFHKLIKRLMKAGVLYQIKGLIGGEVRLVFLMNPHLCKKRNDFSKAVLEVFEDFSKEIPLLEDKNKQSW